MVHYYYLTQAKHYAIPFWGGATSSHLNSHRSIQATRLPLGAVNLSVMHIIPPLTITACTPLPTHRGMEGWVNPNQVESGVWYWTPDLSHDGPCSTNWAIPAVSETHPLLEEIWYLLNVSVISTTDQSYWVHKDQT